MQKHSEEWAQLAHLLWKLLPAEATHHLRELASGVQKQSTEQSHSEPEKRILSIKRRMFLSQFRLTHPGRTDASIYSTRQDGKRLCDRREWAKWKRGELKPESIITKRIEEYLQK